jgi:phosphoribosylformimino-5-aminoimidazole carboxamide ribotide isomerase
MIIFPAIDLRRGKCVRLRQGDPNAETVFGDDPARMARHWADLGAEWLHVVNLDGAFGDSAALLQTLHRTPSIRIQPPGQSEPLDSRDDLRRTLPINLQRLSEIREAVSIPIQFGGGLRTLDDIRLALELGADRVILGTVAVNQPALVAEAVQRWGEERIMVGIDARDGKVATHGWQETSGYDVVELGHTMHALGIRRIVYTDINRDGLLTGVNVDATAQLGDITGLKVIASGGVAGIDDIRRLKQYEHYNIDGVIVGQALYTDHLSLPAAIEVGKLPLRRRSAGLVPYRMTPRGPEFLMIFNLFFDQWQFPRGGVHESEKDPTAAAREFQEETGLPIVQVHEECRIELNYTASIRQYDIARTIIYYPAEVATAEVRLDNENHCEASWQRFENAWELLAETAPEQLPALEAAMDYLRSNRLELQQ